MHNFFYWTLLLLTEHFDLNVDENVNLVCDYSISVKKYALFFAYHTAHE